MKRINVTILLFIMMCSLSGCVRMKTSMNIDNKGNTDISLLYATMDTSAYDGSDTSEGDTAGIMKEFEDEGWTVSEYNRDGYMGVSASLEGIPLDKLTNKVDGGSFGDMNITKKGSRYTIDWALLDDDDRASMKGYESYITSSGGYMTFELTLPKEAIASNATSVSSDGKTLTWDLLNMTENKIHVEFSLFNPLILIGVIGVVCVILVIVVVIVVVAHKKKKQDIINNVDNQ